MSTAASPAFTEPEVGEKRPAEDEGSANSTPAKKRVRPPRKRPGAMASASGAGAGGGAAAAKPGGASKAGGAGADDEDEDIDQGMLSKNDTDEQHRARLGQIISAFTPEEDERYRFFVRSSLPKRNVKAVFDGVTGGKASMQTGQVLAGVAKLVVGELVETARLVMAQWGEGGYEKALQPRHYREAYRRMLSQGHIPCTNPDKPIFNKL